MLTYELINGQEVVYFGMTDNIERAIEAHQKAGKQYSHIRITEFEKAESAAKSQIVNTKMAAYRKNHKLELDGKTDLSD